ncbi:hypothetical protein K503DRAFT_803955 [Rhizopogon vinicolor AM-OR11-026]|uniref:Uncharacterized protein n=1 Tax=Rhizopogon vinicolor AM-OR11-026 TaxID=1314800 RepID=A0A1B7MN12_9AGAM|nr:hypothetical protein K503DRAFT_803955 [Rhizopogon vinicolor AM-OR11-026]
MNNLHPLYVDAHIHPDISVGGFIKVLVQEFINSLHTSQPENFDAPFSWMKVCIYAEQLENYPLKNFKVIQVCISNIAQDAS